MLKTISAFREISIKCSNTSFQKMEEVAKRIFSAAVEAVTPHELITKRQIISLKKKSDREFLEIKNSDSTYKLDVTDKSIHIVGAGKGVLTIAVELESVLGNRLTSGILSVPKNFNTLSSKIKVIEGAVGNLPDHASMQAALEIKQKVESLTKNDVLLCLITGGGSALLSLPTEPIMLEEKSSLIKNLSRAGATITELNVVRIAISQVKGGKLAECGRHAYQIISLIISDIINDPLELIASGPTIPYIKSAIAPRKVLEKYKLADSLPTSIAQVIQKNEDNQDISVAAIKNSQVFLIGSNRRSIDAAMNKAKSLNLFPIFLSAEVQGDVDDISKAFFELARAMRTPSSLSREAFKRTLEILHAQSNFEKEFLEAPKDVGLCIVSGGEITVKVNGDGNGGRNQELALRFTKLCLDAQMSLLNDILLLSCGTDGIDGNCDAAGAIGGLKILHNLPEDDEDISSIMADFILRNDSYNFYKNFLSKYAGDDYHIITGHTGTNVMDIHLLIVPNERLSGL